MDGKTLAMLIAAAAAAVIVIVALLMSQQPPEPRQPELPSNPLQPVTPPLPKIDCGFLGEVGQPVDSGTGFSLTPRGVVTHEGIQVCKAEVTGPQIGDCQRIDLFLEPNSLQAGEPLVDCVSSVESSYCESLALGVCSGIEASFSAYDQ